MLQEERRDEPAVPASPTPIGAAAPASAAAGWNDPYFNDMLEGKSKKSSASAAGGAGGVGQNHGRLVSNNFRRQFIQKRGSGYRIGARVSSSKTNESSKLSKKPPQSLSIPLPQAKYSRAYKRKHHRHYVGKDVCLRCGNGGHWAENCPNFSATGQALVSESLHDKTTMDMEFDPYDVHADPTAGAAEVDEPPPEAATPAPRKRQRRSQAPAQPVATPASLAELKALKVCRLFVCLFFCDLWRNKRKHSLASGGGDACAAAAAWPVHCRQEGRVHGAAV